MVIVYVGWRYLFECVEKNNRRPDIILHREVQHNSACGVDLKYRYVTKNGNVGKLSI